MALTDSFPGPTGITDSIEAGKDVAALLMHENGVPKAGLTWKSTANLLAPRTDMRVDIAPFKAALVRNGAARLLANDSTAQSPQLTIPNANSVIAVVYVKVGESAIVEGETDGPFFGVLYGDPAPIPAKPALNIAGALELGTVLIPSNATGTASAGVVLTTTAPITGAGTSDTGWRTLTLTGATVFGSRTPMVRRINGVVYTRGAVTAPVSGNYALLDAADRPATDLRMLAPNNVAFNAVHSTTVSPAGVMFTSASQTIYLDGLSWVVG